MRIEVLPARVKRPLCAWALPLVVAALAGCGNGPDTAASLICEAPEGTLPFPFAVDGHELFGFVDVPASPGPHPAVLLIQDAGMTDVARDVGSFPAERRALVDAGFAAVVWDKAGAGCSGGRYGGLADLYRRGDEVIAAIDALGDMPAIDGQQLGLWARGQGAWVAPMAATRRDAVQFVVLVGGPSSDPIEQIVHEAVQHLATQGYAADEAVGLGDKLRDALEAMRDQGSFRDYRAMANALAEHPLFPELSETGRDVFAAERRYDELSESAVLHVDIGVFLSALEIPVLAVWGDRDTEVDAQRAASGYRAAFARADNDAAEVRVLDSADHRLCAVQAASSDTYCEPADAFLDVIVAWAMEQLPGAEARQTRVELPAER